MTDKKLTDSEITIKALKELLEVMLSEGDLQKTSTISHTIDLINRLQAENERLSTLAELGNMRANDYRVMRDRALKAEAENENLKLQVDGLNRLLYSFLDTRNGDLVHITDNELKIIKKPIKAEAYKEFAERLKAKHPWKDDYLYSTKRMTEDIDNLLKELVGEDNAENDVKCKDCKHFMFSDFYGECSIQLRIVNPADTCLWGERRVKCDQICTYNTWNGCKRGDNPCILSNSLKKGEDK